VGVNSEVFDHTSLIQFIESRFAEQHPGIRENNISNWRRAVTGDLTSAFNFASPNNKEVPLPSTIAYIPPDNLRHGDYKPVPPADQAIPVQEPGLRPARAVPYRLQVRGEADFSDGTVKIHFGNFGTAAAVYQVYSGDGQSGPWTYTVGPGTELSDTWVVTANGQTEYDLSVFGPNGFLRVFKGSIFGSDKANLASRIVYDDRRNGVVLEIHNRGGVSYRVRVLDSYTDKTIEHTLRPDESRNEFWSLQDSHRWYDFTVSTDSDQSFQWRLAGHLETGHDSMSDPALGASKRQAQVEPMHTPAYA
jgi:phospholipase C